MIEDGSPLPAGSVSLMGLAFDEFSSHLRGSAAAPDAIRKVLHDGSMNMCTENGINLAGCEYFQDLGNLPLTSGRAVLDEITRGVSDLLDRGERPLLLGGDHAITYPVLRAYRNRFPKLTLLHFDAHPDLYETYDGNPYSHACPFARIMEDRLIDRLVQVGIRTVNKHQREQINRFGVEVIEMRDWQPGRTVTLDSPVYISLDMDALDPAFAPGVSHHEPGGLSTREVLHILQHLNTPIVGADIVEVNPSRDIMDMTARVAGKFLVEIAGLMLAQTHPESRFLVGVLRR